MKNFLFENWMRISIPDEWQLVEDHEEALLSIFSNQGVGAVQISFVNRFKEGDDLKSELIELLDSHLALKSPDNIIVPPVTEEKNNFLSARSEYVKNDEYWRVWYMLSEKKMLFITYNCDPENRAHEHAAVNVIIDSITFVGE